jgi:hypothetical protein
MQMEASWPFHSNNRYLNASQYSDISTALLCSRQLNDWSLEKRVLLDAVLCDSISFVRAQLRFRN